MTDLKKLVKILFNGPDDDVYSPDESTSVVLDD